MQCTAGARDSEPSSAALGAVCAASGAKVNPLQSLVSSHLLLTEYLRSHVLACEVSMGGHLASFIIVLLPPTF